MQIRVHTDLAESADQEGTLKLRGGFCQKYTKKSKKGRHWFGKKNDLARRKVEVLA